MIRVGTGYDVHRLVEGRKLILGGVEIPYEKGLLGHSDADVLLHAIMDALLGAAALGDIGLHFPDTAKEYIIARQQMMRPYYLLNEKDSILKIINETYLSLKQLGEDKEAADALVASIYLYIERGELDRARHAMEIFEQESGLFDKDGNIARGREAYYNTKGYYELAINNTASAERYFRKAIEYGHLNDAYKGMLQVVKDYCTFGLIDEETLAAMIKARGKVVGDAPVTDEYVKEKTEFATIDDLAKAIVAGEYKIKDVEGMKPVFRLHPPVKGYEGNKHSFVTGGALGDRKEKINDLVMRML